MSKKRALKEAFPDAEDVRGPRQRLSLSTAAVAATVVHNNVARAPAMRPQDLLKQILIKQYVRFWIGERGVNEIRVDTIADGVTPLMEASLGGDLTSAWMLLQGHWLGVLDVNIEAVDADGDWTALWWAARHGHSGIFKLLLEHGATINNDEVDNKGTNLLQRACQGGSAKITAFLLDNNYGFTVHDMGGYNRRTPLHYAAKNGSELVVELLINHGANLEAKDREGRTPLHGAAWHGKQSVAQFLIERGANLEARDNDDMTPLHLAAMHCDVSVVALLIERGVYVNVRDGHGQTPLHRAAENSHHHALVVTALLSGGAELEAADDKGCTPLHLAAQYKGRVAMARTLLDHGASITEKNNKGITPLATAANRGHFEVAALLFEKWKELEAEEDD